MQNMVLTLKDGTQFDAVELLYSQFYEDPEPYYLIRIACVNASNIQQLYYDVEKAFTKENVAEVTLAVKDGSREANVFNFTEVCSIAIGISDIVTVLEVVLK